MSSNFKANLNNLLEKYLSFHVTLILKEFETNPKFKDQLISDYYEVQQNIILDYYYCVPTILVFIKNILLEKYKLNFIHWVEKHSYYEPHAIFEIISGTNFVELFVNSKIIKKRELQIINYLIHEIDYRNIVDRVKKDFFVKLIYKIKIKHILQRLRILPDEIITLILFHTH